MIIKKRLKYYFPFYLAGYIISLSGTGIPHWYYVIPVKLIAICLTLIAGNGVYYMAVERLPFLRAFFRSLKYIIISFILLFLFSLIQAILKHYSVDLSFAVGI